MIRTLVALTALASTAFATTCTELTTPLLCGSSDVVVSLDTCNSTVINLPEMAPCCRLQTEQTRKCDDPAATTACRSVEVSSGLCPGASSENCCFRKEMSMKLYFEFEVSNRTCCSKCRCYGDPHCESFDGTPDTWVICDARTPKLPNRPDLCPMAKATCLAQLDHLGKTCNWTMSPTMSPSAWDIGMMGSPCVPTNNGAPPFMIMYQTTDFSITLNMGERSIIKHIIIKDSTNTYVMGADDCFTAAYSANVTNPWRTSVSVGAKPPSMPSDWLPYKWTWGPLDGEDLLWSIDGLDSLVDLTVRCTRTVQITNGRRRYGPPRLNVDIVEPLNWEDSDQRPNAGGFCPTGKITRQGSSDHADQILANNWCASSVSYLDVARLLCGSGTTSAGVAGCQQRWCTTPVETGETRSSSQVTQCLSDITSEGWDVTFCATRTINTSPIVASDCSKYSACRTCVNEIKDFGWAAAIAKYNGAATPSDDCVSRDDLPSDLVGFCTKGVRVQYYLASADEWITAFAIPSDTCLLNGYVTITNTDTNHPEDANLFIYPMRIIQCSEPKGTCLTNKCATEIGFKAKIDLTVETSEIEKIYNLFEAGLLICDPKVWTNPTDCLGFTPEKMCPCTRRLSDAPRQLKYISN